MDKDKGVNHAVGLPPSGRYSMFSSPGNSFSVRPESANLPRLGSGGIAEVSHFGETSRFSHDISRMPDNPPKNSGHRRAHSEILTLPDDISFDSDLGVVGALDGPSFSDDTEEDPFSMYFDIDKINYSSATSNLQAGESSSAAGAKTLDSSTPASLSMVLPSDMVSGMSDKPRVRHQHSHSMDGSTTIKAEMLASGAEELSQADAKKSMSAAKLAELALVDPKRAKRIWANRQSAARSKERKMRYIAELERKVQTLQTEATSLSAQLTLLQRDTNGLTVENSELKMRLQTMEQQVHLQDALNDALKEEIQHLKVLTGQVPNGGPMMSYPQSFGANQQYYLGNRAAHTMLTAQQFQQLQINSQKQQQQQQFQQHQFQQQQKQPQSFIQPHNNLLQQSGDLKFRASVRSSTPTPTPTPTDGATDMNASSSKD